MSVHPSLHCSPAARNASSVPEHPSKDRGEGGAKEGFDVDSLGVMYRKWPRAVTRPRPKHACAGMKLPPSPPSGYIVFAHDVRLALPRREFYGPGQRFPRRSPERGRDETRLCLGGSPAQGRFGMVHAEATGSSRVGRERTIEGLAVEAARKVRAPQPTGVGAGGCPVNAKTVF